MIQNCISTFHRLSSTLYPLPSTLIAELVIY
jgi:hypothetical protein